MHSLVASGCPAPRESDVTGEALAGAFRDLHAAAFQEACREGELNTEPMPRTSPLSTYRVKLAGRSRHARLHVLHVWLSIEQQMEIPRSANLLHMHMSAMVGLQVRFMMCAHVSPHGAVW